jgi:hypothetical protein
MISIRIRVRGVKCDNPACDYKDDSYVAEGKKVSEYLKYYAGRPCPECGENLMSKYHSAKMKFIMLLVGLFNVSVIVLSLFVLYKLIF